jgi:hypothetical protein
MMHIAIAPTMQVATILTRLFRPQIDLTSAVETGRIAYPAIEEVAARNALMV